MDRLIGDIIGQVLGALASAILTAALSSPSASSRSTSVKREKTDNSSINIPSLTKSLRPPPRAALAASSDNEFGREVERLVNISFSTSFSFPSMMKTYLDVINFIKTELTKRYPTEEFVIIIGKHPFNFDIDYALYMAVVKQKQYKVLVYSIKRNLSSTSKVDTHDADSGTLLVWNS
ncbi:unnamed protein product [Didymodactylos carnosus]|uniref:Uncharacterized protein n=1 Tax=Didymodactylos carnosus TaxID=1234261 RepID=A0A813U7B0_9BILA|nr:unnamed protein product [Didymodactylos carnosus]CAF0819461.1 unnamed protein product [Didymodactylos carnosus]CAF3577159.1 unnamed protein product [Didymodactylos carnosus]CAF3605811.1 unnamed protein product [Didymodactylos carnosus]